MIKYLLTMGQEERIVRLHPQEILLSESIDVVIVGAGLSGLCLSSALSGTDVNFIVLDKRSYFDPKEAMYLVSKKIANKWGIEETYMTKREHQSLISGVVAFAEDGQVVWSIKPNMDNSYGFAPLPQTLLEKTLCERIIEEDRIFYGVDCQSVSQREDSKIVVYTDKAAVTGNIVIDATGWKGDIIHQFYCEEDDEDYIVEAIFGGNYPTSGFNPQLLYFIDALDDNKGNWVMPISEQGSEVVAAQQIYRSGLEDWWEHVAEEAFKRMIDWYHHRGYQIATNKGGRPMAFRREPAGKKYFQGLVLPFGEAAGLNSPIHGQLIDVLPYYAQTLAEIIQEAKQTGEWGEVGKRFYEAFLKRPPYYYLLHSIFRENKKRADGSKVIGNYLLLKALQETFDETTLWRLLHENGLGIEESIILLKRRPIEVIGWILSSAPAVLSLAVSNPDLFLQFYLTSCERLMARLRAKRRDSNPII